MAARIKSQSAMEYLMTYGWMLLIIVVVVAVLLSLGIFNPSNLSGKAQPGSCQVVRPNGPGTIQDIGLSGLCSGELPEYVAKFNGVSSYISLPVSFSGGQFTATGWFYAGSTSATEAYGIIGFGQQANQGFVLYLNPGNLVYLNINFIYGPHTSYIPNSWNFVTVEWDGTSAKISINGGAFVSTAGASPIATSGSNYLGILTAGTYYLNGQLADIQIYNTSLSQAEIATLYGEGIGGAPTYPQRLVGWWPLNGNPNDYSGNEYNGNAFAVSYTSTWTSGYSAP